MELLGLVMGKMIGAEMKTVAMALVVTCVLNALAGLVVSAVGEEVYDLCKERGICSECVHTYAPPIARDQLMTVDLSVALIGVQGLCSVIDSYPRSDQAEVALCMIKSMSVGVRADDWEQMSSECNASAKLGNYFDSLFITTPCMMFAVETGKIFDAESASSAASMCQSYVDKLRLQK